ncbi:helix-turn-helix domain-containing protein [Bradyrhizobium elkanii]|uniref:helix-turn-helix domain-containing protein n=1 Tax=Bradyrhizobium elkanii TaxID=29448 RepID=UPI003D1E3747
MPYWTTHELPPDQQFGFWREVLCQAFITLDPTRTTSGGFSGSVSANLISDINVTRLLTDEHRVTRSSAEIRQTPLEYYFVNMQIRGDVVAKQRGREVHIRPNEFYIVDSTEPYDLDYHSDLEIFSFRVPKKQLDPLLKDPSESTAVKVSRDTPMGTLAVDFLQSVLKQPSDLPRGCHKTIANTIIDMVALCVGGNAQAMEPTSQSTRHALLNAILKHVERNLHDPELSVDAVCQKFRISPRNLHRAFEVSDMSFGESLRSKRLELCASELSRIPNQPVSSVAFSCGFNDVSYFNRVFREKFGSSPSEYRRARLTSER